MPTGTKATHSLTLSGRVGSWETVFYSVARQGKEAHVLMSIIFKMIVMQEETLTHLGSDSNT